MYTTTGIYTCTQLQVYIHVHNYRYIHMYTTTGIYTCTQLQVYTHVHNYRYIHVDGRVYKYKKNLKMSTFNK